MPDTTLLSLSGMGVPPYSARGLSETLSPIGAAASMRRTVNGTLVDLSASQFRKYAIAISGSDQQPPACDGIWPGQEIIIDCISELCILTDTEGPRHAAVSGSEREDGDFTFYRPQITARVVSFQQQTDEYGAVVAWTLSAEEV